MFCPLGVFQHLIYMHNNVIGICQVKWVDEVAQYQLLEYNTVDLEFLSYENVYVIVENIFLY